jgi:hypothetical protein
MKKLTVAAACVLFSCLMSSSQAVPVGTSNEEVDYTISARFFHNWSCGIYAEGRDRTVDAPGLNEVMMSYGRIMGYVGYDFLPGFTFYVTGGGNSVDIDDRGAENAFEYGAGLNLNIIDHEVLDPTMFEDRLRLNGNVQVTYGTTDLPTPDDNTRSLEWQEVFASLVLAVVNDCAGDKFFAPFSVSLFAGPIYSEYFGDDLDPKDKFGITAGMEIFYGLNLTFTAGVEVFDEEVGYVAGAHFRF